MTKLAWLSPNGTDTCVLDAAPTSILVATMGGVVELERSPDGDDWSVVRNELKGHHISSIMVEPKSGAVFAGTHGSGLYRSMDGGKNWAPVMRGITSMHVFALGMDVRDNGATLYAGTEPSMLFKSTDLGNTWIELEAMRKVPGAENWNFPAPPHISHVKHIITDPRSSETIYICVEQGALLKSSDGGQTFEVLQFEDEACRLNNDAHRIVFSPINADDLLVDGGDGIFRSTDAGKSWKRVADTNIRVAYPDQLYYDPDDTNTFFVVGAGTPPPVWRKTGDASPAIIRTDDGGKSWKELTNGIPEGMTCNFEGASMMVWPNGYGFLIGTSDGEVLASFDKGKSWSFIARDLHPVSKCCHFGNIAQGRAIVAAEKQNA